MIYKYLSPLGVMVAAARDNAVTGLWFEGQKYFPKDVAIPQSETGYTGCHVFTALRSWLDAYFKGDNPEISFALAPDGSGFRRDVWSILREIPYGSVTTYGAIAKQIAAVRGITAFSAQAVGGAVGHNPISILIPCHRVIGTNGSLTGYAGGLEKKRALLELESYADGESPTARIMK